MTRRWLLAGIIAIGLVECVSWFLGASIVWALRDVMVGSGSPQGAANARLALAMYAATGMNLVALIIFALRGGHGWGRTALLAMQIADLAVSLFEAITRERGWWLFAGLAALILGLLYRLHRT